MILLLAATNWLQIQADRWDKAEVRPEKVHYVQAIAAQIERNKSRYVAVSRKTGVPWEVVAVIHNMEGSLNFRTHLFNGDSLQARTIHVPRNLPRNPSPPYDWETGADAALAFDGLDRADWRGVGKVLQNVESYNGTGHQRFHQNVPTPYLWSWTTIYDPPRGKYVEDGQWSATAASKQCGAVPILKQLRYGK